MNPGRIYKNFGPTSFRLDADDIARIDALDSHDGRVARHPDIVAD